ncbi:MAG: sigma-70 family RNA polymerase sigma factor [Polyangiaceae bacterium]
MGTNDWELFDRWLEGSHDAGLALLDKYRLGWLRYLRKRHGADCEDILQQAMLACIEGRGNFRKGGNFGSYVFGILRNQLGGQRRKRYRESQVAANLRFQTNVDDEYNKLLEALEATIASLPHELRDVLTLRFVDKMTRERAAMTLDIPPGTVASRERRAKRKLFELLSHTDVDT